MLSLKTCQRELHAAAPPGRRYDLAEVEALREVLYRLGYAQVSTGMGAQMGTSPSSMNQNGAPKGSPESDAHGKNTNGDSLRPRLNGRASR